MIRAALPADAPTPAEVRIAADRIRDRIRRTPLELSEPLSRRLGREVFLKLENLQRTGSFKVRGALNALLADSREDAQQDKTVVTASAGNHGLGVAHAARLLGAKAVVFVPGDAPRVKRERIRALGAEIRAVKGDYDAAHDMAVEYARSHDLPYLHAFSDRLVVAGQGTVGLEILDQLPEIGTVVVPVGGGGLLGGIGSVLRSHGDAVRVVGVQSELTAAMHRSLAEGSLTSVPVSPTLCDGLAGDVDEPSLRLAQAVVERIDLVSESAVADAIRALYFEEGVIAEGSGAVGVAAVRSGLLDSDRGPIVIVVTGGNIDASKLATILEEEPEQR